jgi:hypothetical protein
MQQIIFGNHLFEGHAANQPQKSKNDRNSIFYLWFGAPQKERGPSTVLNPVQKEENGSNLWTLDGNGFIEPHSFGI